MLVFETDEEARHLLPGEGERSFFAVLFHRGGEEFAEVVDSFDALEWPRAWKVASLDLDGAPETAAWFGVQDTPCLTVIRGGSLLACEYECNPGACERLMKWAREQQSLMTGI